MYVSLESDLHCIILTFWSTLPCVYCFTEFDVSRRLFDRTNRG